MENSVLTDVKKMLGLSEEYTDFDTDLLIHINSVLMILGQMGVVEKGTTIKTTTKWATIVDDLENLEGIKSYMYLKVRMLFDPPSNVGAQTAINEMIREFEWRMFVEVDPIGKPANE